MQCHTLLAAWGCILDKPASIYKRGKSGGLYKEMFVTKRLYPPASLPARRIVNAVMSIINLITIGRKHIETMRTVFGKQVAVLYTIWGRVIALGSLCPHFFRLSTYHLYPKYILNPIHTLPELGYEIYGHISLSTSRLLLFASFILNCKHLQIQLVISRWMDL